VYNGFLLAKLYHKQLTKTTNFRKEDGCSSHHLKVVGFLNLIKFMKHEEIYHTCDRCGKTIKPLSKFYPFSHKGRVAITINRTADNSTAYFTDNVSSILEEVNKDMRQNTVELTIHRSFSMKSDTLELCGKCAKEFKKFMRNCDGTN
jgi:endogenous inhibitor of DNA gyrase (YacG/DUF329 family)